ncbi:hypothetical protein LHK_01563 [Laribacter hongkongensis HLHK9]|uniref:Uncharacterized protein n=1 Tax=Laribacter hongkongensis (strain HLHK9) TaxID=557598 RepID=C1D7W1_LARHH|nr:hypothetical protein LHK_01563 [Laribacter hongkongensis HLHK9]
MEIPAPIVIFWIFIFCKIGIGHYSFFYTKKLLNHFNLNLFFCH